MHLSSSRDKIRKRRLIRRFPSNGTDNNNNDNTRVSALSYSNVSSSSRNESVKTTSISTRTTATTLCVTPTPSSSFYDTSVSPISFSSPITIEGNRSGRRNDERCNSYNLISPHDRPYVAGDYKANNNNKNILNNRSGAKIEYNNITLKKRSNLSIFNNNNDLCSSSSSNIQKINNTNNNINKFVPLFAINPSIATNINVSSINIKEDGDDGNEIDYNNNNKRLSSVKERIKSFENRIINKGDKKDKKEKTSVKDKIKNIEEKNKKLNESTSKKKKIKIHDKLRIRPSRNRFMHNYDDLSHVGSVASTSDETSSNRGRCSSNDSSKVLNAVKEYEHLKMKNNSLKQKPKSKVADLILSFSSSPSTEQNKENYNANSNNWVHFSPCNNSNLFVDNGNENEHDNMKLFSNNNNLFIDTAITHNMQEEDKENSNPIRNQSSISYLKTCAQNKNQTTNATKQWSAHDKNKNQTNNHHSLMLKDKNHDKLIKKQEKRMGRKEKKKKTYDHNHHMMHHAVPKNIKWAKHQQCPIMQQHKQTIESSYDNVHSDTGSMSSITLSTAAPTTNKSTSNRDSFTKANTAASNNILGSSTAKKQKFIQLLEKITNHSNTTKNEYYYIGRFKNIKNVTPNTTISSVQSLSSTTNASFCYSTATGERAQQSKLFLRKKQQQQKK